MDGQANITEFTDGTEKANEPETVRLKHLARINPTKSELSDLDPKTDVSFVPLEDFGTDGEIKDTETRPLEEVYDGYTYFREGDIAIAKITPSFENGKGAICRGLENGIGFGTTELHILRPRKGVNTEFLWYVLRSKPFMDEAETAMRGVAGQQRVPTEFIEEFRVDLPRYEIQTEMSNYLSSSINNLRAASDKLGELREYLSSKRNAEITNLITGRRSDGTRELAQKETPLIGVESIPEHWETARIGWLISSLQNGWSPNASSRPAEDDEYGVLKLSAVSKGEFRPGKNKALSPSSEVPSESIVSPDQVLVTRANTPELVADACTVDQHSRRLIAPDLMFIINVDAEQLDPRYLSEWLVTGPARSQIRMDAHGSSGSMVKVSQQNLKDWKMPLPPKDEQEQILEKVDQLRDKSAALSNRISEITDLLEEKRQALVTAAVTSQIDVPEVESEAKTSLQ
ncbi:restriction endonuclease subunit S [Haloferax sp. KTX1]|uniref:restriction endonuclease subunit S n=1 Tax=Haloferax sp. KTX1 TaxID=2600597 RepID=UPI0011DD35BA|nr:restriction endonuclease subunit S [Haloferax sp. KTX1]